MLKNALDLPPQHRPGWNGQRIQTINVDIEVEPGWSQVPLSLINELKVSFYYQSKFTVKASESNARSYR